MKSIPNFPDYAITKDGRVWSKPKKTSRGRGLQHFGRWLKPGSNRGYWKVILRRDGKPHTQTIHRLVLETYVGTRPKGLQCRHLNGNKKDNRLENLRWGTGSENAQDEIRHGGRRGEKNGRARLVNSDIGVILYLRNVAKFTLRDIAWQFNMSRSNIGYICAGKTWQNLNG